jgi:hypothetical protein
MSAQQTFALCIDCWEFHYGISDSNGVYSRDSGSSNHFDHAVHVFRAPDQYAPPIKGVLISLQRGEAISDGRLDMFSLACAVTAIQPNNGRKVDEGDQGAVELLVQKRQRDESRPQHSSNESGQTALDLGEIA